MTFRNRQYMLYSAHSHLYLVWERRGRLILLEITL